MITSAVRRRCGLVLVVTLLVLAVPFAGRIGLAHACGCGAYSPAQGGTARVPGETALVRTTGDGTEDVYLSIAVDSSVRTGALLFPVPDKHATVSAGPKYLFPTLAALTAPPPPVEHPGHGNAAGAADPGVTVENQQSIGPLDVVTLSSGDPAALTQWLTQHGFTAKPALTTAARPYTSAGWAFVAVKLRPAAAATTQLDGALAPLHLHFASRTIVYPMRLSALGTEPEQVTVYTLAPHRMTLTTADPGMSLQYARRLAVASPRSALATVTTGGTTYLTRYSGSLTPATITGDFAFTRARTDSPVLPADADIVSFGAASRSEHTGRTVAIVAGGLVVVVVLVVGIIVAQRRRSRAYRG